MAFRAENQKILLTMTGVEKLLGLPEGVEVTGFHARRDPPVLEIFLYNPHAPFEVSTEQELPLANTKVAE
jgi:hypothetical protein